MLFMSTKKSHHKDFFSAFSFLPYSASDSFPSKFKVKFLAKNIRGMALYVIEKRLNQTYRHRQLLNDHSYF